MSILMRGAVSTAATAAVLLLALAGCSASGAAGPAASKAPPAQSATPAQSKTQACTSLENAVSNSTSRLAASFGQISTDPAKAIDGLQAVADAFDSGLTKVTNATVKSTGAKADASLKEMIVQVKAVIGRPSADTAKLKAAVTAVQADFTAIGTLCA